MTRTWPFTLCLVVATACSGKSHDKQTPTCGHGIDPSSPQCNKPQCSDGIDNDGDGLIDYPNDPGCTSPNQNSEVDDCPNGPNCPQCANGIDDDGNGLTDYAGGDPGCTAASDPIEYTENPFACGTELTINQLPANGQASGMFDASSVYTNQSPCKGGGQGGLVAVAYELDLTTPKVITASSAGSSIDTVIDIRTADCTNAMSEVACNNDVSSTDTSASVTTSLHAGVYFIIVESFTGETGAYSLNVQQFPGENTPCMADSDCGPGLVCRVPQGQTAKVCSQPMCNDGVDNDGDGKIDYPNDPGCTSPQDNDETDDCPNGPNCPQCGNGIDDDGDGLIDYPADPSCKSASGTSEACDQTEGVTELTMPMTSGDTTGATDDYEPTCALTTGAPDLAYQLALPDVDSLDIQVSDPNFSFYPVLDLLDSSCGSTELSCQEYSGEITQGALPAGNYYLVVDGDDNTSYSYGTYTITVSGTIAGGGSCEGALAQSGALTCASGYACKGSAGSMTCQPTACNDGIDNDMDGKIDYPNDPGCTSPSDDDETDPATPPVCSNGVDDDMDGQTDFPADFGCSSAAGTSEVFCSMETDPVSAITMPTTTGDLTNLHSDLTLDCGFATDHDQTFALQLPEQVKSLTIDTTGSTVPDTVLELWDTQCDSPGISCNDDIDPVNSNYLSTLTVNDLAGGNYAVTVQAYDTSTSGAFHLNVHGTVAKGKACTGTLFTNGVLACEAGSTCTAGTCQ